MMLERFAAEGLPLGPNVKVLKSDRRVDIVAEGGLAGRQVAVDNALHGLAQKSLTEIWIVLRPRPDSFLEIVSEGHY